MPAEADEAARADDHEGDGSVGRNDEVVDLPDPLLLLVVDVLTEDLLLEARDPSEIDSAFAEMTKERVDAVMVSADTLHA